jgi:hypothetical protein
MKYRALLALALVMTFAACSAAGAGLPGGAPSSGQTSSGNAKTQRKGTIRIEIKIPKKKKRGGRRSRYISAGTKSFQITISPAGGGQSIVEKVNVTGSTLSVSVQLSPGKYLANVSTYDKPNEAGNCLSAGQALPFELVAGQQTTVTLVLDGVPHTYLIEPDIGPGSVATGFTAYGAVQEAFSFVAMDADGYYIVGPGAPVMNIGVTGAGWSVTPKQTTTASIGQFDVTPPGANASSATIKLSVVDAGTCTLAGSACTISFTMTNVVQNLYVAVCGVSCNSSWGEDQVAVLAAPFNGEPIANITNGIVSPVDVAVDKAGNVFVLNNAYIHGNTSIPPSITEYTPKNNYASPIATITSGLDYPTRIALDAADDVIVMNGYYDTYDYPSIYTSASHYTAAPIAIKMQLTQAIDMKVNSKATIIVASCGTSCGHTGKDFVAQFPQPYSATEMVYTIPAVDPLSLTIDPNDNLWIGECLKCTLQASDVEEHLIEPGTNYYSTTVTNLADETNYIDGPDAIAVDSTLNLFIEDASTGSYPGVSEYAPPYNKTPTVLFGGQVADGQTGTSEMGLAAQNELLIDDDTVQLSGSLAPYSTNFLIANDIGTALVFGEAQRFAIGQ